MKLVSIGFVSYLIGCFTAGYIIGKLFFRTDITKEGSGNLGTTNAFRTLGVKAGALTLLVDLLKGFLAVFLASKFEPVWGPYVAALFVVIGHNFPFHLNFKGGKGVATSAGVVLFFSPLLILVLLALFFAIVLITKKVSLGSVMAAIFAPFVTWFMSRDPNLLVVISFLALLLLFRHKDNIKRLLRGEEKDFTWKRSKS